MPPEAPSFAAPDAIERVVILNDFCYVQGGASKVAIDEAVALSARGIDVTFLGAVGQPCETLRSSRVRVVSLDQPELIDVARHPSVAWRSLFNRAACAALQDELKLLDRRRTVVHLHGYTKALTASPAKMARGLGFRTVCTLHDFFAACPNGAFYDYNRESPCSLVGLSHACIATNCDKRHPLHKAYRVVRGMAQRHIAQFPTTVRDYIALSRRSSEILKSYLPQDAAFYHLDNIIDMPQMPPVDVAANRNLVVLGRLDAEKGVDLVARAMRDADNPIVFAGEGPLRPAMEAAGAKVTGWLSSEQVSLELGKARCLLFPSRWYETYGLVVSEAAARGVPAVVSDICAAAERVVDGVSGWTFRSGNVIDLQRCLAILRNDDTVRAAGLAAYQSFWSQPSDRTHHVARLLSIYAAVLARDPVS